MTLILITWFFTLIFLQHIGILTISIFQKSNSRYSFTEVFFIGFIATTVLLSLASLLVSISLFFVVTTAIAMLVFSLVKWRSIKIIYTKLFQQLQNINQIEWLSFSIVVLIFAFIASSTISLHDTGLYHAQSIKWIQEYAVVPGLGNLHGRFAFNSHFFVVSAFFAVQFFVQDSQILIYPLNAVALLVLIFHLYTRVKSSIHNKNIFITVFYLVLLLGFSTLYPSWMNSPSPDIISAVLVVYAVVYFIENYPVLSINKVLFILSIVLTVLCFKLSYIFLLLLPGFLLWEFFKSKKTAFRMLALKMLTLSLFILGPFVARNAVLSGYLIYPFSKIDVLNVDWKIPKELVNQEAIHIKAGAKIQQMPDDEIMAMKIGEWLPVWWKNKSMPFKVLLAANFLAIFSFLGLRKNKVFLITYLIVLVNLIFWFFSAPDPRFIQGFLFLGMAIGAAVLADKILKSFQNKISVLTPVLPAVLILFLLVNFTTVKTSSKEIFANHLLFPSAFPQPELVEYTGSFNYITPKNGQQCYNAALPCLPVKNNNIVLRGKSLQQGFKTYPDSYRDTN